VLITRLTTLSLVL